MTMTQRYAEMLRRHAGDWDKRAKPVQAECARQAARHMEELQSRVDAVQSPWQPMRTAPKDGLAVLALVDGSDIPRAVRWLRGPDDPRATEMTAGAGWHLTWDGTPVPEHDGPRYWMRCPDEPDAGAQAGGALESKRTHEVECQRVALEEQADLTAIHLARMQSALEQTATRSAGYLRKAIKAEAEIALLRAALNGGNVIERLQFALQRLADAADTLGVNHFGDDWLSDEVQELQAATRAARLVLGPNPMLCDGNG